MDLREKALALHEQAKGKLEIKSKVTVESYEDLSLAYSPGVAEPCKEIARDEKLVNRYTNVGNTIAIVTDGTAVLGLGDIGPKASLPVMEGKAILFKEFAGVDAFPICLDTQDTEEIIETVQRIAPSFGGINLEDISAPRCFEIEKRLDALLPIPVFHDDQHGTAIVVLAALLNALKLAQKNLSDVKIVVNGPGAAGTAIINMLLEAGAQNIVVCDEFGILAESGDKARDPHKIQLAKQTNPAKQQGNLKDALEAADVFIGVSAPNVLTQEMIRGMNQDPIIFALANPTPEITYDEAKAAGALIVGTGRSDYPNQINNVLVFPGIFKGVLASGAISITKEMKIATAYAIADTVGSEELNSENILPSVFDKTVVDTIVNAIKELVEETR